MRAKQVNAEHDPNVKAFIVRTGLWHTLYCTQQVSGTLGGGGSALTKLFAS